MKLFIIPITIQLKMQFSPDMPFAQMEEYYNSLDQQTTPPNVIKSVKYYLRRYKWIFYCQNLLIQIHSLQNYEKVSYPIPENLLEGVSVDPSVPYQSKEEIRHEFGDVFNWCVPDQLKSCYYAVLRKNKDKIDAIRVD